MKILPEILESTETITQIRRNIHAHPELRFEEKRTAELVAEALSSWGIPVFKGLGKTGVVGRIDGELGTGKMIGLRADIDALPLQEKILLHMLLPTQERCMLVVTMVTLPCSSALHNTYPIIVSSRVALFLFSNQLKKVVRVHKKWSMMVSLNNFPAMLSLACITGPD